MYTKYEQWLNEANANDLTGEAWLNAMHIKNYTINSDGTVDVKGNVNIQRKGLTSIPVQFGNVNGHFLCNYNKLSNLKGCPKKIKGSFECSFNELTSLEGCPKEINGDFVCNSNKLTSLTGGPKTVGGDFACFRNNLTSLKGAPEIVKRHFYCSFNNLTSLKGGPETVGGDFWCSDNVIKFTEDDVTSVSKVKDRIMV